MQRVDAIRGLLALAATLTTLAAPVPVPEPEPALPDFDPQDLPRFAPLDPAQALAAFAVRPGFRVDLVAAEPLVADPIGLSFDEQGRMFVLEMADYSERRPERLGRVRRLEDTDGDGRYDRSTVFAKGLPWPTAMMWYGGGVYVGATPDLRFFKDTDGDGVADTQEVVFTGFGSDFAPYETNRLNMQAMLNNLTWGLDNRIHGATGFNGGKVRAVREGAPPPVDLRGRDFSFDPRRLDLRPESGGGQHGWSFDNRGRKFICSNSDHLQLIHYADRYAAQNPFAVLPSPRRSIAVDGPAAAVYRTSPEEPWRVLRTRWRVGGLVPGPIEGGGRASGYFTSAAGLIVYRGDAFPVEYLEDVFVCDCGSNLVHRKKLRPRGTSLEAVRPAGEEGTEFLTSRDTWFRPVQLANAPDGALYVVDMYREIIEHPWSLPQPLKSHLDLNAGNDRGRIYRVAPVGFAPRPLPKLGGASTAELVATLGHPNAWHRETASRLLYERQDAGAVPALETQLRTSPEPLGRLHALGALDGLGAVTEPRLRLALHDSDGRVREHAVRLSEGLPRRSAGFEADLLRLSGDPDALVRYQLAFTLGAVQPAGRVEALIALIRRDHADPWMRAAVLSALASGAGEVFAAVLGEASLRTQDSGQEFLQQLAEAIGARNDPREVARVLDVLEAATDAGLGLRVASALERGLARAGASLARVGSPGQMRAVLQQAAAAAKDPDLAEAVRVQAAQFLGAGTFARHGALLVALLGSAAPPAVQQAAIQTLARYDDPKVATALLYRWEVLTPRLRGDVLTALLKRPDRVAALLEALERRVVLRNDLGTAELEFLRQHPDAALRARALAVLGAGTTASERQALVEKFRPALQLPGVLTNGHRLFVERCASCHRLAGEGYALGPDFTAVRNKGKESLLTNFLDPNREVPPSYVNYQVDTKDGDNLFGIVVSETAASVTLRRAFGDESVVLRSNLEAIQSQGLSAMPEDLEAGLTLQEVADLLEYVTRGGP